MADKKAIEQNRALAKEVLARTKVEISSALERVDKMGPYELAELKGSIKAFFDFNGICGAVDAHGKVIVNESLKTSDALRKKINPVAFFDFNGIC